MTPTEAEDIINEYGVVLENTSSMVFGAPETALPFARDIIKQAIKEALAYLKRNPRTSRGDFTKDIDLLKIAYASLANFIPAEDARIAAEANAALLSGDTNHPGWVHCDRGLAIADENLKRRKALAEEFALYLKGL